MRVASGGHAPGRMQPVTLVTTVITAVTLAIAMLTSAGRGAARLAVRLAGAVSTVSRQAPAAPPSLRDAQYFTGTPAVGALFYTTPSGLGSHFCTGSVVDSPSGDLVITAAHCVTGTGPGQLAFVPGYHNGQQPYGVWQVTRIFVDPAWTSSENADDDVAFLVVKRQGSKTPIQSVTGGEQLGTGWSASQAVRVIGYPAGQQRPLTCQARTRPFGPGQMEFDCAGYTDGTSGAPFLAGYRSSTGEGTVIGVIGGFEQGGDTPAVSYSVRFGTAVRALFQEAVAGS
jgi:V8-like Glu-specific endopeptidase